MAEQGVRVRFIRDLPSATSIGGFLVPAARGPVRQRLGQPPTPTSAVAGEVELTPGDERLLPPHVAEALGPDGSGYVELLDEGE